MHDLLDKDKVITNKRLMAFFAVVFIILVILQFFGRREVQRTGVYSIGTITDEWTSRSGYFITISYRFGGKMYEVDRRSKYGGEKVGDLCFIQLLPEKPKWALYLEGQHVPGCLRNATVPEDGWKRIPSCIQ